MSKINWNLPHGSISDSPTTYRQDNFSPSLQSIWSCSPSTFEDAAAALAFNPNYSSHHRHDSYRHLTTGLHHQQHQQLQQCSSQREFRILQQRHGSYQEYLQQQGQQQHHQQAHFSPVNSTFSGPTTFILQDEKPLIQSDKNCGNIFKSEIFLQNHQQQNRCTTPTLSDKLCHPSLYTSSENNVEILEKRSPSNIKTIPEDLTQARKEQNYRNNEKNENKTEYDTISEQTQKIESTMASQETINQEIKNF